MHTVHLHSIYFVTVWGSLLHVTAYNDMTFPYLGKCSACCVNAFTRITLLYVYVSIL